jgi:inosine/xanthosine triphosphatase
VIVASNNPVKVRAAAEAFRKMMPAEAIEVVRVVVPSGVADQPMSDEETFRGALNRARRASALLPGDFFVGIEGGVEIKGSEMESFAWVVVLSGDTVSKSRTGTFYLPSQLVDLVNQGKELGEATDLLFGKHGSKLSGGTVGTLTGDIIDRTRYYEHALILALAHFKNPELYGEPVPGRAGNARGL